MDRDKKKKDPIYFQVLTIRLKDPETGDLFTSNFIGQALVNTPEKWDKLQNIAFEKLVPEDKSFFSIGDLYNPFTDTDNAEAHRYLTDLARSLNSQDNV